jgi:hypothetical protein
MIPTIKIWIEDDGLNCFRFFNNDKAMRLLTKMKFGLHIEVFNIKVNIHWKV